VRIPGEVEVRLPGILVISGSAGMTVTDAAAAPG
jgi:hypothetical protein